MSCRIHAALEVLDLRRVPLFGGRVAAFGTCDTPNSLLCLDEGRGVVAIDPWGGNLLVAARYDGSGALVWSSRVERLFTPEEQEGFWYSSAVGVRWEVRRWVTKRHVAVLFVRPGRAAGFLRLDLETGERSEGEAADLEALYRSGRAGDKAIALEAAVHLNGAEGMAREAWAGELSPTARIYAAVILARAGDAQAERFLRKAAARAAGEGGDPRRLERGWRRTQEHEDCRAALRHAHRGLPEAEADRLVLRGVWEGGRHSVDALIALGARNDRSVALGLLQSFPLSGAQGLLEDMCGPWGQNHAGLLASLRRVMATSPSVRERRRAAFLLRGLVSRSQPKEVLAEGLRDSSAEVRAAAAATLVQLGGSGEPHLRDLADGLRFEPEAAGRCRSALALTGEELKSAGRGASWVLPYVWWREAALVASLILVWFGLARRFPKHRAQSRLRLGFNFGLVAAPAVLFALLGLDHVVTRPWADPFVPETFGSLVVPPVVAVGLALTFACLCGAAAACLSKPRAPQEEELPAEEPALAPAA